MSHSAKQRLLLAAVTGMLGAAPSLKAQEPLKQGEVKCYGVNSCGAHAKCGSASKVLNWTPASADVCREQGGFTIDGADGSKAARKP
jgi:hypothetical protein